MGEITEITEQQSTADRLREQIRHTESDITETVQTLEHRLSPSELRQRGARKAKYLAWHNTAKILEFAQKSSVQVALVGASALLLLLGKREVRHKVTFRKRAVPEVEPVGTAAKAMAASLLMTLLRRVVARKMMTAEKPAISGMGMAATMAKAFLTGARSSEKKGTTRPGRRVAWRGLATAIGSAMGSAWYSHKEHRV